MTGSSHCTARKGTVAAVALVAIAGSALGAAPASASGSTVTDGKNITVVHNIDMVALSGFGSGEVKVEVLNAAGTLIGSETADTYDVEGAMGLEINHGTDETARDGDCWDQLPDIRPGHKVRVTGGGVSQQITVDDIRFVNRETHADWPVVIVRGIAKVGSVSGTGSPIPLASLDNSGFRNVDGKFRATPIAVKPWAGRAGGFELHYSKTRFDRNRRNLTKAQRVRALMTEDGHATGYGHFDGAKESQFLDGFDSSTAAVRADGC